MKILEYKQKKMIKIGMTIHITTWLIHIMKLCSNQLLNRKQNLSWDEIRYVTGILIKCTWLKHCLSAKYISQINGQINVLNVGHKSFSFIVAKIFIIVEMEKKMI